MSNEDRGAVTPKWDLMTVDECAVYLRKSTGTLRWMLHQGTAPKSGLVGGRRMFRRADVDIYIAKAFGDPEVNE